MAYYNKISSAVYNNVFTALRGITANPIISLLQIEDLCIQTRLSIIKEFSLKGLAPRSDLLMSLNCIPVDCKSIDKCSICKKSSLDTLVAHFEIPQVLGEFGTEWIDYIGTTDKQYPYIVYTSLSLLKYNKYRKVGKNKPYIYIDITPNSSGLLDCFLFNAPLIKLVSVIAVFKDPRLLELFSCCENEVLENITFIDTEVEKRVSETFIRYYRLALAPILPNNQTPK